MSFPTAGSARSRRSGATTRARCVPAFRWICPAASRLATSGQLRWTDYRGSWGYFTPGGTTREDRTRILRVSLLNRAVEALGFSPQLALINEVRESNAQLYDYRRNRVELGLQRLF